MYLYLYVTTRDETRVRWMIGRRSRVAAALLADGLILLPDNSLMRVDYVVAFASGAAA